MAFNVHCNSSRVIVATFFATREAFANGDNDNMRSTTCRRVVRMSPSSGIRGIGSGTGLGGGAAGFPPNARRIPPTIREKIPRLANVLPNLPVPYGTNKKAGTEDGRPHPRYRRTVRLERFLTLSWFERRSARFHGGFRRGLRPEFSGRRVHVP